MIEQKTNELILIVVKQFIFKNNLCLKWYYDENRTFPFEAILKHKKVDCMRRKMLFTIFKYLFSIQRYSSF